MTRDAKGQPWCMVRVQRRNNTEFLDIIPGTDDPQDLAVLGVYAWAAFPTAKAIFYENTALVNPVKPGAFDVV